MKRRKPPDDPGEVVSTRVVNGTLERTVRCKEQWRSMPLTIRKREAAGRAEGDGAAEDEFTVYEFPFSSEEPVERWIPGVGWGYEVLSHAPGDCDLSRLKDGGAWRDTHWGDQVGVSDAAWIEEKRGWTGGRFSKNTRPQEIERDLKDKIRRNVSVGYIPTEYVLAKAAEGELSTYRCKWVAYHIAFVPDPADATVGMGRDHDDGVLHTVVIRGGQPLREEHSTMKLKKVLDERGQVVEVAEDDARAAATEEQIRAASERRPAPVRGGDKPPEVGKTRSEEVDEIRSAATDFGVPNEVVADILARALTPDQAIVVMRQNVAKTRADAQPAPKTSAGLSWKDAKRFRIRRALSMAANLRRIDGVEGEAHRFLVRNRPQEMNYSGGFMIPYDIRDLVQDETEIDARHQATMERLVAIAQGRMMDTITHGQGPELVGAGVQLIDLLRPDMALAAMGATIMTALTAPIPFAKKTAAVSFAWYGEGKPIDLSNQKYVPLELGPKRVGGAIDVSNELLLTSSMSVDRMIESDMAEGGALTMDQGGLTGAGGVEPLGILNLPTSSGIQSVDMGNTVPTWAKLTSAPGKTARKNGLRGRLGWLTTPELAAVLMSTPRISGAAGGWLWEGDLNGGTIAGYPARQTSQLLVAANGDNPMIFGPWQDQIIGYWGGAEVKVDPYTQLLNNVVRFVLNMIGNTINRYPEAFVKITGARTS